MKVVKNLLNGPALGSTFATTVTPRADLGSLTETHSCMEEEVERALGPPHSWSAASLNCPFLGQGILGDLFSRRWSEELEGEHRG